MVHPDRLGKAPTRVREENTRSLKTLNDHLDRLRKGDKSGEDINLRFYIPEKENLKSKEFLDIEINLSGWSSGLEESQKREKERKILEMISRNLRNVNQQLS